MNEITREQLKQKLAGQEPFFLLEALPAPYFEKGHLPGALNVPHDRIDDAAPRLLGDKSREIVVYCASITCQNSTIAARRLEALGYERVSVYAGGKADWVEAGEPLEAGRGAESAA